MTRSNYNLDIGSDEERWAVIRWRGAVKSAIRGQRGQRLLSDLADALDSMPVKELTKNHLVDGHGEVCALGALARSRQLDIESTDPEDAEAVAALFDIAPALAREVAYQNDEWAWFEETPAGRWSRMRRWVEDNLIRPSP